MMVRRSCALVVVILLWTVVREARAEEKSEAAEHFQKGVSLFKAEDYDGALAEFTTAYEAKPHFAVRYNLGICLYKLHRYAEAQVQMSSYLVEGGDEVPADKREEIEAILEDLEDLVGMLKVNCNVKGAELVIDGDVVSTLPLTHPLRLDVGEYRLEVRAEGYEPQVQVVLLPGGKAKVVEFVLVALEGTVAAVGSETPTPVDAPEAGRPRKKIPAAVFWTGLALTVAGAAGAAVTGGLALARHSDYEKMAWTDSWSSAQSEGMKLQLVTNVLWGVTGAFGVTTLILAFFTDFGRAEKQKTAVTPLLGPAGLAIQGVF